MSARTIFWTALAVVIALALWELFLRGLFSKITTKTA